MQNKIISVVRKWMIPIVTIITAVVLFGVIFVELELVTPDSSFYIELGLISALLILIKATYFGGGENAFEDSIEFEELQNAYYDKIELHVTNISDLDEFLEVYNEDIKKQFIKEGIGFKTEQNYGIDRLEKLEYKLKVKADKIKPLRSLQIKTRDSSFSFVNLKNYRKINKYTYYTITSILSILMSIGIASVMWKDMSTNPEAIFRYVTYLLSGASTGYFAYNSGFRITQKAEISYLKRLNYVVDKYIDWKKVNKREVIHNGE